MSTLNLENKRFISPLYNVALQKGLGYCVICFLISAAKHTVINKIEWLEY